MKLVSSIWYQVSLVILFSLVVRLISFIVLGLETPLNHLPWQNDRRALQLLEGQEIFFANAWSSFYILLGFFYYIFEILGVLEQRVGIMVVIQHVLASVSIGVLLLLAKSVFSTRMAVLISLTTACYYPFIYLGNQILSETTAVFCLVICFYLLIAKKFQPLTLFIAGLLLAIAIISRPILLTFLPFVIILMVVYAKKGHRLAHVLTFLLAIFSVMSIAGFVNQLVSHQKKFSLAGSGGVNIAMANCELKKITYRTPEGESFWFAPPAYHSSDRQEVVESVPFYNDLHYLKMGLECIRKNPTQLITNLTHIGRVFDSNFYPNFHNHTIHKGLLSFWKKLSIMLTLCFLGFFLIAKRKKTKQRIKKAYFLSLSFFLSLFISVYIANPGEERYLVTYFFVLPLFGISFIFCFFKDIKKLSLKRLNPFQS